ncbi:MAG: thymidylate synthase [Candidatus Nanohaloarchaea archaeon]|nr:thymidylate synthase [Candidatus Nanohaloarchaea archaeon]
MEQYLNLVRNVLQDGNYKPNRTGVDTVSTFMQSYEVDLQDGFPLLTTKKMDGFRWNSLIHELLWYFSGEHHIRNLREETKIWDDWADDDWNLPTAYGRFWRRYPLPDTEGQLDGEWWPVEDADWIEEAAHYYGVSEEDIRNGIKRWVSTEEGNKVFDQVQYIIDTLNSEHPYRGPESRRLIVNAWHPANAAVSKLPPCHYTFAFNVQNDRLNLHLTQRSGDVALGIPFNIAAYSLIAHLIAGQTDFEVGTFGHTVVDAHIYCGKGERGRWYDSNIEELREKVQAAEEGSDFLAVRDWIEETAPAEDEDGYDHVPGLLKQLSREPLDRPSIDIADRPLDELEYDDIQLDDYRSHDGIRFEVAE